MQYLGETAAVTFVVFQPTSEEEANWSGIAFGLLASICQASGVVISHYALVAVCVVIKLFYRAGQSSTVTALYKPDFGHWL